MDETAVSLIPNARKTWSKKGKTPIVRHQFRWPKLSGIAGVTPRGNLFFRIHKGSIKEDQVIAFLRHLMRHSRKKRLIIVWDGGPSHKSGLTKAFIAANADRLEVHQFPV